MPSSLIFFIAFNIYLEMIVYYSMQPQPQFEEYHFKVFSIHAISNPFNLRWRYEENKRNTMIYLLYVLGIRSSD